MATSDLAAQLLDSVAGMNGPQLSSVIIDSQYELRPCTANCCGYLIVFRLLKQMQLFTAATIFANVG
jgi:hypothetical protein